MYKCPQCSAENIQKASIIYENGTSDISLTMAGGGISTAGGIIGDGGYASGTSQSKLASKMAPPKEKSMLLILFLL